MAVLYYEAAFAVSLFLTLIYAFLWNRRFGVHFTLIFGFIPIDILGTLLIASSKSLDEAVTANKIVYLGGCFLQLLVLLKVFQLCNIRLKRIFMISFLTLSTVMYLSVLTNDQHHFFYKELSFDIVDGTGVLIKEYGFMHSAFYVMIIAYLILTVSAIIYSYMMKKDISRKILALLLLPELVSVCCYFLPRLGGNHVDFLPLSYIFAQIIFIIIIDKINVYDITDTGIDSLVMTGDTGIVSFDQKYNYLGSNETAKQIFPELKELTVDKPAELNESIRDTAVKWLRDYEADSNNRTVYYKKGIRTYLVDIRRLYDGRRQRGYQFFITDDTANQQYISLLNSYNTELKEKVAEKTSHIVEMHDKLILGMATMVESRDNSTGGHIRRTSEGVRILIDEMKSDSSFDLSDEFCSKVVKAAPMHDLGKIAVDDAVLRKPGRFTDEEYAKMKQHAAEGARIVHEILVGTDDEQFHIIAENVAHYHHERWDGSGYPEGLKGEDIPIEARIMAIADVYDALVSKRVYKEKMSFEQADAIITEGMGKQFDKSLEPFYQKARPKLEAYYKSLE